MGKMMALKSVFPSVKGAIFAELVHFAVPIERKDE